MAPPGGEGVIQHPPVPLATKKTAAVHAALVGPNEGFLGTKSICLYQLDLRGDVMTE